jgi:hypothetical protein
VNQPTENNLHTAFGGQVVFETEPYITAMVIVRVEHIEKAIPSADFGETETYYFGDFKEIMSRTISIIFNLDEKPSPVVVRLKRFWEQAQQQPRNWPALWELFLQTYDENVLRPEFAAALMGSIPEELAAAPELRTPLKEEDGDLPDDHPKSVPGANSTAKRSRSSRRKDKQNSPAMV